MAKKRKKMQKKLRVSFFCCNFVTELDKQHTMRHIDEIIIHCTATPAGRWEDAASIERWHVSRGFRKIGYHYVILLDGKIEEGRPIYEIGAHAEGHNDTSVGVVYVGGLDPETFQPKNTLTPQQVFALKTLLINLRTKYPGAKIIGHNEISPKACPCFDVQKMCEYFGI